jgi:WD40 repeat protein
MKKAVSFSENQTLCCALPLVDLNRVIAVVLNELNSELHVRDYDITTGNLLRQVALHERSERIYRGTIDQWFHESRRYLVCSVAHDHSDSPIYFLDFETLEKSFKIAQHGAAVTTWALKVFCDTLVTFRSTPVMSLTVWDLKTRELQKVLSIPWDIVNRVNDIAFGSLEGVDVVALAADTETFIYDARRLELLRNLPIPKVLHMDLCGSQMAVYTWQKLALVDLATGRVSRETEINQNYLNIPSRRRIRFQNGLVIACVPEGVILWSPFADEPCTVLDLWLRPKSFFVQDLTCMGPYLLVLRSGRIDLWVPRIPCTAWE